MKGDLIELCDAVEKALTAMENYSGLASQAEGAGRWDEANDAWRRYDHEANALKSFAALIKSRNAPSK